jgi:hypothetical protein
MLPRAVVPALIAALAVALAGCRDAAVERNNTAVLGGYGPPADRTTAPPTLIDATGQTIPPPPVPSGTRPQMARAADGALAVWIQGGDVMASSWTRAAGWTSPQALERIGGDSSEPQVAANTAGMAMVVWHHTVGNIHSLRFSRRETGGEWSVPDVLPGALPRPSVVGTAAGQDAPQLQMDAEGKVVARWPSGFHANEMQVARYSAAEGWTRAVNEPVASAPAASPAPPAPSSAR